MKKIILVIVALIAMVLNINAVNAQELSFSNYGSKIVLADTSGYIGDNFCSEPSVLKSLKLVGFLLLIAKIAIPLIIIAIGIFEFYKVVTSGEDKNFGTAVKKMLIRIVIGIIVFFIPNIFGAFIGNFLPSDYKTCKDCLLYPTSSCNSDNN